jgi:hypothetical protein
LEEQRSGGRARASVRYFVRDDDVGELTDALRAFSDTFISRRIPVSYQIIPSALTDECAAFLRSIEAAHPDLVEFGQHGLHHAMTLRGKRLKREFGPERPYDQQLADIRTGLELLLQKLGRDRPIEVFTPPRHKYDRSTVLAAASVGHRTFSAACYPSWRHQSAYAVGRRLGLSSVLHHGISYHGGYRPEAEILERSIAIAVDDGQTLKLRASALSKALARAASRSEVVGLMLHHAVYNTPAGRSELAAIADCLAAVGSGNLQLLGSLGDRSG